MPETSTLKRAARDRRQGKSPGTQAGEFVRQEMRHIREGKHGAKSAKQAIAIGLSEARRAGVAIPDKGKAAKRRSKKAASPKKAASSKRRTGTARRGASTRRISPAEHTRRSRATKRALKRMPRRAASHRALSRQAHAAARKRTHADRSRAARKAARTRAR